MSKIRLGSHVREIINGRTGTACERVTWLFGCDQITMLPDVEFEKDELQWGALIGIPYEEKRLEELEDTRQELLCEENKGKQDEFFGKWASDKVTGFKGIIIGRKSSMYSADQYYLVPKVNKKGVPKKGIWIDEGRVNIIGEGINERDVAGPRPGGCEYRSSMAV